MGINENDFSLIKYNELLYKARITKYKKIQDYNSNTISRFDYALHGNQTFLDDIYKKFLRLKNLTEHNKKPKNETIEDTFIDIINYCADFYSYIEYYKTQK